MSLYSSTRHIARATLPTTGGLREYLARMVPVLAVVATLLVVWEVSKLVFAIPDQQLPHVLDVFQVFWTRTQGGAGPLLIVQLLRNAWATFGVAMSGFVLGGVLGFALALVFVHIRPLERGLMPYVIGSQTVPILAIAPMVVVGLGRLGAPDWMAKAVVAAYLTFFPVTIGMLRGLRAVSPDAMALMRSYAASPLQILCKLRLPASLPYLFTSLKVAATASVIGAIVAELPAASHYGIGTLIVQAAQYYNSRPTVLYAAILVAGAIGLLVYGLVVLSERLLVPARQRGAA
jgi:NitT/TauT family transport system permease protein